jgi:DNA-binding response OmpR family regulator
MRVLLVEDEPGIAQFISQGLRETGYAVDIAQDGEEGREYISFTEYDVIILDIMLPNIDGLNLLGEFRSQKIQTPVLLLTARDTVEDRVKCKFNGCIASSHGLCPPFQNLQVSQATYYTLR